MEADPRPVTVSQDSELQLEERAIIDTSKPKLSTSSFPLFYGITSVLFACLYLISVDLGGGRKHNSLCLTLQPAHLVNENLNTYGIYALSKTRL